MTSRAVLDLDHPDVRIESELTRDVGFGIGLGDRLTRKTGYERTIRWTCIIEGRLRRWTEQLGGPVQSADLNEDCAGFVSAAPPQNRRRAGDLAAPQVSGDPEAGFQPHADMPG